MVMDGTERWEAVLNLPGFESHVLQKGRTAEKLVLLYFHKLDDTLLPSSYQDEFFRRSFEEYQYS